MFGVEEELLSVGEVCVSFSLTDGFRTTSMNGLREGVGKGGWDVPSLRPAGRPLRDVILFRRSEPPAMILALRRSRRRRAASWPGVSSVGIWEVASLAEADVVDMVALFTVSSRGREGLEADSTLLSWFQWCFRCVTSFASQLSIKNL